MRAVAYGWRQERITQNAQEISELGKELYNRMTKLADYLNQIGKGLTGANNAFNKDLGAATGSEVPPIEPIETIPRALTAPELSGDGEE